MATTAPGLPTQLRPNGFRAALRLVADALEVPVAEPGSAGTLESSRSTTGEPPRLTNAELLEDARMKAHRVSGDPAVGFAAFLDGVQASRVLAHDAGMPIIHGTIGAVVRERIDRRLATWRSAFEERLYAPRAFLSPRSDAAIAGTGS